MMHSSLCMEKIKLFLAHQIIRMGTDNENGAIEQCPVGVDFGGTCIKAGRVQNGQVVQSTVVDTRADRGPEAVTDAIAAAVKELTPSPPGVGLAIPGEADAEGRIWRLPNVSGFEGVNIAAGLQKRLGCPVVVENDATAAALGENLFGHGRMYRSFLMVTLGTGIGGGLVIGGQVRRGTYGFAGEIGHVLVDSCDGAWLCSCGCTGCMEAYAGTKGILRKFTELGGRGTEIRNVAQSARCGETAGCKTFEMMGWALGAGLSTIQNVLDLEAIVFTGGVSQSFDLISAPLRAALKARVFAAPLGTIPLLPSEIGACAGLVGAACLVAQSRQ